MSIVGNYRGPNIVKEGLVLYLDVGSPNSFYPSTAGTTWKDISGNKYDGVLLNGPTYNSSVGGNIVFDGTNDYMDLGDKDAFTQQSFTFEIFFKPQSFNRVIISKYSPSGYEYDFGFYNGTLYGWVGNNPYSGRTAPIMSYTSLNTWGHYVWSVDATSNYLNKLYFNGVQIDNSNFSGGTLTNIPNTASPLTVGLDGYGLFGPIFGSIGSLKMYNRPLSNKEIIQNYNATKTRFGL